LFFYLDGGMHHLRSEYQPEADPCLLASLP
jgi:hypothetical protein